MRQDSDKQQSMDRSGKAFKASRKGSMIYSGVCAQILRQVKMSLRRKGIGSIKEIPRLHIRGVISASCLYFFLERGKHPKGLFRYIFGLNSRTTRPINTIIGFLD